MQDLDDGVPTGRDRVSALAAGPGPKVRPFIDDTPGADDTAGTDDTAAGHVSVIGDTAVVPGDRLLEVATALSQGASLVHDRLRDLDPDERDALLDLVSRQMGTIVHLWADLVRGVVATEPDGGAAVVSHPRSRPVRLGAEAPAWWRGGAERASDEPPGSERRAAPATRRLPRRREEGERGPRSAPLRSVRTDESQTVREGDRLTRDELTGVLNRQAGFAALGRDLDRARRAGDRFVLGYLDVDGLRLVNRAEGTGGGDELLRKVTAALRATLRSYDVVMRLGGDEFLFCLPGADLATAERRAHEFGVLLAEEAPGATASVGYSELRGSDTLDEMVSRAEEELVKSRRARVRDR